MARVSLSGLWRLHSLLSLEPDPDESIDIDKLENRPYKSWPMELATVLPQEVLEKGLMVSAEVQEHGDVGDCCESQSQVCIVTLSHSMLT